MRYTEELKERVAVCFANRGLLCNWKKTDEETKDQIAKHVDGCSACQEWSYKHKVCLPWKVR